MLRKGLAAALALGAVTLTACSESLGPNGSATEEERTEVIQVAEESGFFPTALVWRARLMKATALLPRSWA